MSDFNIIPLLPELFLAFAAMGLLIVGVSGGSRVTPVIAWMSVVALAVTSLLVLGFTGDWSRITILNEMLVFDEFSAVLKLFVLVGSAAAIAMSVRFLAQEQILKFEYPILILFATIGMMVMLSSHNFLTLYMGLELQALSLYVLAAFQRNSLRSSEAGVKYFLLGALSSGMLLFGVGLIYGFTGSLDFTVVAQTLAASDMIAPGVVVGLAFILAGLAFKISAVPFHMWTPDVYQGAPTSVTAFFAIVPKIAAMGLLIRVLFEPFAAAYESWMQILYALSLGSMVLGAFAGLVQKDIKRLLAYSSIGNMGYILIGVIAGSPQAMSAVIIYMMIYLAMTIGVFAIVIGMRRNDRTVSGIDDLAGLSKNAPFSAYALAILMFSMSGIPPMAGFFGKLVIFESAVAQEFYILAILGVITSVVAAYYYLKIIKTMFFDEVVDALDIGMPFVRRVIVVLVLVFVLGFGIKPTAFADFAEYAATALFYSQG
jgi:NADH-quinone oxidoreductase subunit N